VSLRQGDLYLGHRITQALEAALWVRMAVGQADLVIYAGDFNTEPGDLPYALLTSLTLLTDSWREVRGEEKGSTCMCPGNSYTSKKENAEFPAGKRIDYIMYRPGPNRVAKATEVSLPLPHRIPESFLRNCSYSDHEAVQAVIRVEVKERPIEEGNIRGRQQIDQEIFQEAVKVIEGCKNRVYRDQYFYSILAILLWLLFFFTFGEHFFFQSVLLDIFLFLVRLVLMFAAVFCLLMASVFNRKERHALSGCIASLKLLLSQNNYGSL